MKAITLYQPWASLVAIGAKRVETRKWTTRYQGPLAIHAAQSRDHLELCQEEPFRSALRAAGILGPADLPFGAVLCERRLIGCVATEAFLPTAAEWPFGDYGPGRFAWLLEGEGRFAAPAPVKGWRSLWTWEEA